MCSTESNEALRRALEPLGLCPLADDLRPYMADIPLRRIAAPAPWQAVPIAQALDKALCLQGRALLLALLARTLDSTACHEVHPLFAQTLCGMAPLDIRLFQAAAASPQPTPLAQFRLFAADGYIVHATLMAGQPEQAHKATALSLTCLEHLDLLRMDFTRALDAAWYEPFRHGALWQECAGLVGAAASGLEMAFETRHPDGSVTWPIHRLERFEMVPGLLEPTPYGRALARCCFPACR